MRNTIVLALSVLVTAALGCSPESSTASAEGAKPAAPVQQGNNTATSGPINVPPPPPGTPGMSGDPGLVKHLTAVSQPDSIQVRIVEVQHILATPGGQQISQNHYLQAVKVQITARADVPRPLIQPQCFALQSEDGKKFAARFMGPPEPALRAGYLPPDEMREGWMTFEIPLGVNRLFFWTNVKFPELLIPLDVTASSR
jgi:hypothetical protein